MSTVQIAPEHLRFNPHAKVADVWYVLVQGDGNNFVSGYGYEPLYVWKAVLDLDYTAPEHVQQACEENYALAVEMFHAERLAGWPSP